MIKLDYKILTSPIVILTGTAIGILIGLYFKGIVPYIAPIGKIYVSLLQMCVIPIIIAALISSIGKLVKSKDQDKYFFKIIMVFAISLLLTSAVAITSAFVLKPLIKVDKNTQKSIGKIIITAENKDQNEMASYVKEIDSDKREEKKKQFTFMDFLMNVIPKNIFEALNNNENLKIIFFFIIFGVMMKFVPPLPAENIIMLTDGIFEAFQKLIGFLMYFLPFGLCSLMAFQFSKLGIGVLASLVKFAGLIYITGFIVFFISTIIIWRVTRTKYREQFENLGEAIMISFGSGNSLAAIPSALRGLKAMKLNEHRTHLTMPIGILLARYGDVTIFSLAAIFAAQLYDKHIGPMEVIVIMFASVIVAMATSGTAGVIAATMVSLILAPLGIPSEVIILILIILDPLLDPIGSLLNLYPNCAATTIIAVEKEQK